MSLCQERVFSGGGNGQIFKASFPQVSFLSISFHDFHQTEYVWLDEDRAHFFSELHNQNS